MLITFKRGTHLRFNAIKMLKKLSLALLTQVETNFKMLKRFYCILDHVLRIKIF